jgi:uncharacterized membrane protein YfcA
VNFDTAQWICAVAGALMVGISKTGISGLSVLAVALFAYVFPSSKQASGLVLPLLIFADVVIGYLALGRISDRATRWLIGGIILALSALSFWRRRRTTGRDAEAPLHGAVAIGVGVLAGFVTLIANAAGPLMAIYLLAMRLPKMQYVGTAAMFFMLLNLFKVPFMAALGLVTPASFAFNLYLLPAVLAGTVIGRWLLWRIDQGLFENLVLVLSAVAGLLLVW